MDTPFSASNAAPSGQSSTCGNTMICGILEFQGFQILSGKRLSHRGVHASCGELLGCMVESLRRIMNGMAVIGF